LKYRFIIFDFDGTLADTFPYVLSIINKVAEAHNLQRINKDDLNMLRTFNVQKLLEHFSLPIWKVAMLAKDFQSLMTKDIHKISLFQGIDTILKQLHEEGVKLALVSSNSHINVTKVLGEENADLFDHYECGVSILGKKDKFLKILRNTGFDNSESLCIGDEIRDIEAAKKANIPFGAVSWGYTHLDALQEYHPEETFFNVDDIYVKVMKSGAIC